MKSNRPHRIGWVFWLALFVLLAIGLAVGGGYVYRGQVRDHQGEKFDELRTISQLKLNRLVSWRNERLGDVRTAASGAAGKEIVRWLANPGDSTLTRALHEQFSVVASSYGYQNVMLVARDGQVLFSMDPRLDHLDVSAKQLIDQTVAAGKPVLGDFFRCSACKQVHIDALAPVVDDRRQVQALVVLRSDPDQVIYPLIQAWPTASRTAETLLVRREADDALFLNTLRHRRDPALTLRDALSHQERPAVQAVLGKTGVTTGIDYRGVEVIASLHRIPDSPWFLVAKVDSKELLEEVRYRSRVILIFAFLGVVMSGLTLGLIFYIGQATLYRDLIRQVQRAAALVSIVPNRSVHLARRWSTLAGLFTFAIGAMALLGWLLDLPTLKSVLPGYVAMKANSAMGLALAGSSLALLGLVRSAASVRLSKGLASVTILVGFATLVEYVFGVDLGIDQLLFTEAADAIGTLSPGRMAPATALNFVIVGLALGLAHSSRHANASQRLAFVAALVGLLPLIGYLYGATHVVGMGGLALLAIHTAIAFVILSIGIILVHPNEGLARALMANTLGGWLLRRLIPFAIGVPPLLGWMRVQGERLGAFESAWGVALLVITLVVLLVAFSYWTSGSLTQMDAVRSAAERRVLEGAEELRATLYGIGDGVLTTDDHGQVTRMNPVAEQLTGWAESEALGKPLDEVFRIVNEATQAKVETPVTRVLRDGRIVGLANHTALIARDGKMRPIADSGAPIRRPDGQVRGVVLVFRDQSAERASQSAVRQAEGNFEAAFHGSPVAMSVVSVATGKYVDVNEVFLRDFGFPREEVVGRTSEELQLFVEPSERNRRIIAVERDGNAYNFEMEFRMKSGAMKTCLISTGTIQLRGMAHYLSSILDISERKRIEEDLRKALIESRRLLGVADESRRALLSMMEDQKFEATRRRQLEEQLNQSQKMESIGRLAGGVAHDFNNLISVILNFTSFAMDGVRKFGNDGLLADLAEVQRAATRAAALTHQLLAFSRRQVLQPVPLCLNDILRGLESMLRRLLREDIELMQLPATDLGLVCADPNQMEQVVMNLVVNAGDAMPNGGRIVLETANAELDEACIDRHVDVTPGPYIQVTVTDTGCGMNAETKARIFEPFFTTKEPGKGTGLGLSTVYGIVKQSGGSIWVYSEQGRGTTFKVYLPRIAGTSMTPRPATKSERHTGGTETILVTEDEEALRSAARRALEAAGYTVLLAANGQEALLKSQSHEGAIHLLLTDVVMPGLNGRALASELTRLRPGLTVLFMSGYTDDTIVHHGMLDAGTHFIAKPFTAPDLTAMVRRVLDHALTSYPPQYHSSAIAHANRSGALDGVALLALPSDIRVALHRTLISARYDELVETLERIRPIAPELAAALQRRVEQFDYDEILNLLARNKEERSR